jgi:lipoprotein signal peptidase
MITMIGLFAGALPDVVDRYMNKIVFAFLLVSVLSMFK